MPWGGSLKDTGCPSCRAGQERCWCHKVGAVNRGRPYLRQDRKSVPNNAPWLPLLWRPPRPGWVPELLPGRPWSLRQPQGAVQGRRRGRGGWWGARMAGERGRERNKRALCGWGRRRGAHYPMPRSHVGNKRAILWRPAKQLRAQRARERFNPMGAGDQGAPRPQEEVGGHTRDFGGAEPAPSCPLACWAAHSTKGPTWPLGPLPAAGPGARFHWLARSSRR